MPEKSGWSLMCLCLFLMQSLSVSNTAIWLFTLKNKNIPPHMKLVSCNVDQCCWVISRFTLIFCCSGRKHDYYLFISLQPRRVSFLGSHLLLRPLWSCRKPPRAPQSAEVLFSSRHSDIERGSLGLLWSGVVVAPTPLSDSLFLSPLFW